MCCRDDQLLSAGDLSNKNIAGQTNDERLRSVLGIFTAVCAESKDCLILF